MSIIDDKVTSDSDLKMVDEQDSIFQIFTNDSTSWPLDEKSQQAMEKIQIELMNAAFNKDPGSSISTLNNLSQANVDTTKNIVRQQQLQLIDDDINSSMNSNSSDMNADDDCTQPEEIFANIDINEDNNNTDDTIQHDQTLHPLTTDDTYTDEQQMNGFEYLHKLIEILTLAVTICQPELVKLAIPDKIGDLYLKNLPIPLPGDVNITDQNPLEKFSNLFETGIYLLPYFRPIFNTDNVNHTDPVGTESNETSERTTSEPSEHNGSNLNQEIQTPTQSKISVPCIPKDSSLAVSVNPLSQLLLKPLKDCEGKTLIKLEYIHPPKSFWNPRYITDLAAENGCPPLASEKQRQYIITELSDLMEYNENDLFVSVQLLTHDDKPHPSKVIVPPETTATNKTLEGLVINNEYGWNLSTNTILYPYEKVKYDESCDHQIQLQVLMFNKYQNKKVGRSKRKQGSTAEDIVENHQHDFIEKELHKICKLRVKICRRTAAEQLECVSEIIDTNLIKEKQGPIELTAIDETKITPQTPCECGNEEIIVPLNVPSEKAGFVVIINERTLPLHEFIGGNEGTIQIKPPTKTPDTNGFHLFIAKINVLKAIEQNYDPYENLLADLLLDTIIKYGDRNDNCHHCFQNKKRKKQNKE